MEQFFCPSVPHTLHSWPRYDANTTRIPSSIGISDPKPASCIKSPTLTTVSIKPPVVSATYPLQPRDPTPSPGTMLCISSPVGDRLITDTIDPRRRRLSLISRGPD